MLRAWKRNARRVVFLVSAALAPDQSLPADALGVSEGGAQEPYQRAEAVLDVPPLRIASAEDVIRPTAATLGADPGPDFLCIGMQKTGTGWLFDQLKLHPDFWVPPIKGTYYLDKPVTQPTEARQILDIVRNEKLLNQRTANLRPLNEADLRFLKMLNSFAGQPRNLERYAALFRFGAGKISGEITPGYSRLDQQVIAHLGRRFPKLRVIVMLRDPVERLWSQISMNYREKTFAPTLLNDDRAFRSFLQHSKAVNDFAFPSKIVQRWQTAAPHLDFKYFFFDDLVQSPDATRARIISCLGGDSLKPSGEFSAERNRKSGDPRLPLTTHVKDILVDYLSDELRLCSTMFGGPATTWKARYLETW